VGGYGLVGAQAARLLRERHPDLPLVLAGRRPATARELAASLRATTARVDVGEERPLRSLPHRPAAVLAAVSDPHDHLLADAMRAGIPIADINRGGAAAVLDAFVRATTERPRAPVLLSGSWLSGLTALVAAAAVREIGGAERVEVAVLVSSGDRVGDDAWGFSKRLAFPYHAMAGGRRQAVQPLTGVRHVRCADGRERPAARVGTLEQITLPIALGVPTVETRIAPHDAAALWALVGLKRSGALRTLELPALRRVRAALLHRSGPGDFAGFGVTAHGDGCHTTIEVLDVRGQSHLNAVGAARAAERVLGLAGAELTPGVSFPEQSADPPADLAALSEAGVVVRRGGFRRPAPAPGPPATDADLVFMPTEIPEENLTR
jgi:hypothetical protein